MVIRQDISAQDYHRDPAPEPSLSSSVAQVLVGQSPAHARLAHPRLNPDYQPREPTPAMELGTAVHGIALGFIGHFEFVDAPDWRTKAAKQAREIIRSDSAVALLEKQRDQVFAMAESIRKYLPSEFTPEVTILWSDNGAWFRARLDVMADGIIYDIKTTGLFAHSDDWGRTKLWDYAMQVGLYRRAYAVEHEGELPRWRFIVQEDKPPYASQVYALDEKALAYCDDLAARAMFQWANCMEKNEWPAYPDFGVLAELPGWLRAKCEDAE